MHVHKHIAVCTHAYGLSVSGAGVDLTNRGRNKSQIKPPQKKITRGESILLKLSHFAATDFLFGVVVSLPPPLFYLPKLALRGAVLLSEMFRRCRVHTNSVCPTPSLSPLTITSGPVEQAAPWLPSKPQAGTGMLQPPPQPRRGGELENVTYTWVIFNFLPFPSTVKLPPAYLSG